MGACDMLIQQLGCKTAGFLFLIELEGCKGRDKIKKISENVISLAIFD